MRQAIDLPMLRWQAVNGSLWAPDAPVCGAEAPSVGRQKKSEVKKQASTLQVDASRTSEPLRVCVRNALENYFGELDGHSTRGLHQLVIAEVEAPLLEAVLAFTGGNQTKAAEVLGINRGTLRKKLREYNIG